MVGEDGPAVSGSVLALLRGEHGHTWEILDWYGGWIAYRLCSWSPDAEAIGIRNVVGADDLDDLADALAVQATVEARFYGRPVVPRQRRTSDCRGVRESAR